MGEVVNLNNVNLRQQPCDFAEWLEDMAASIRERSVDVRTMIVVIETGTEFTSYATSSHPIDTARTVGLLHIAAAYKTRVNEDDPLGWRTE